MPNFVSPGVYTFENDASFYAPSVNPTVIGVLGFASRGPSNEPTLITTPADLIRQFGTPDMVQGGQGLLGALEILEQTRQLYYIRVATDTAAGARVDVPLGTCPTAVIGYNRLDSNYAYKMDVTVTDYSGNTIGQAPTELVFYRERPGVAGAVSSTQYTTATTSATAWHETVSLGLGKVFGGNDAALSLSSYVASGWLVARDAGKNVALTVNNTYFASAGANGGALDFDGATVSATPWDPDSDFDWITLPGGAAAYGAQAKYIATFSGHGIAGTDTNYGGYYNSGITYGVTFVPSGIFGAYRLESQYDGLGYNYSATTNELGQAVYRGLRAKVRAGADGRNYIEIESDGNTEESFETLFYQNRTAGESLWPEDIINQGLDNPTSQYIKGNFGVFSGVAYSNLSALVSAPELATTTPDEWGERLSGKPAYFTRTGNLINPASKKFFRFVKLVPGNYNFTKGNNGDARDYGGDMSNAKIKTAYIGTPTLKTGMYGFDRDDIPVTIALAPGVSEQNIQNSLVTLAETSKKFLAVLGTPLGFTTAQQAIAWTNGNATGRTSALNSSYAAVYWPWVKSFDAFTGKDQFYDPAIYAVRQMAYTDEVADAWFAPAGLLRGRLTRPVDVEVQLSQGDRDALYGGGNCVNPIVKFNTDGIAVYGQRTTQRAATALDRINVRRLMIYLHRLVLDATRQYVFEPNDPILWETVRETLNPALSEIQSRRGITEYKVICDSSTNTPLRIDRNELWCKVIIKPTKAAEVLVFELNLTNQSSNL